MDKLFSLHGHTHVDVDVVIVGGGIVGVSTAYAVARTGTRSVAVLERRTFGWEASGRNAGGVRQQGRDLREIPLAMLAVSVWAGWNEELQGPTYYRRSGNIYIATTRDEMRQLVETAEAERRIGLETEILSQVQLTEKVPALSDLCVGGKYCRTDGIAEPEAVMPTLASAAGRLGVRLYPSTEVLDLTAEDGRITEVVTERIVFHPRTTVIAAGPWTPTLLMRIGVPVPLQPVRAEIVQTAPLPPLFEEFLIVEGHSFYARPTYDGRINIGPHSRQGPSDLSGVLLSEAEMTQFRRRVSEVIPALGDAPIERRWHGLLDVTPDEIPILGPVTGVRNCFIAAGFSGHGFCLGPGVGRLLAEWIVEGKPSLDLSAFSLERFREGPPPGSRPGRRP